MKKNNTIIDTFDKFKNVPLEYSVLLYMVYKELLLTNDKARKMLKSTSDNYLIIASLISVLNDYECVEGLDDISSKCIIMRSLNFYIRAAILCNQDNIGLASEEFNNNFTVFLFNLVKVRIKLLYPSLRNSNKKLYKKTFATIQDCLYLIENKNKKFRKFIDEYKGALEDYSQRVVFGVGNNEDCYYDDEMAEDENGAY